MFKIFKLSQWEPDRHHVELVKVYKVNNSFQKLRCRQTSKFCCEIIRICANLEAIEEWSGKNYPFLKKVPEEKLWSAIKVLLTVSLTIFEKMKYFLTFLESISYGLY